MRAIVAILGLATGASALAAAAFYPGPARPTSALSLPQRIAALRINRTLELPEELRRKVRIEVRVDDELGRLRISGLRERPFTLECKRTAGTLDLSAIAKKAVVEGVRPADCDERDPLAGDVRFFEVDRNVRSICPGQYDGVTEEQIHDALYLPALASTRSKRASVLEPGRLLGSCKGTGQQCDCGPDEANCLVTRGPPSLVYCGNVRPCAPGGGSCFAGKVPIKPADVATSLYYYRALVTAQKPSDVGSPECGPTQTSLYRSSLVSEAITQETVDAFIGSGALDMKGMVLAAADNPLYQRLRQFLSGNDQGICFVLQQFDERSTGSGMIEQALSFPVFAPFDASESERQRASPLLRALQSAAVNGDKLKALFAKGCDLEASKCGAQLERIQAQLRASLGKKGEALASLSAAELPLHIAGSGTFRVSDYDPDSRLQLTSWTDAPSAGRPLSVQVERLWPEAIADQRAACKREGKTCYFRSLWSKDAAPEARPQPRRSDDRAVYSLVGLFARSSEANARCVRRLYTAIGAAPEADIRQLQAALRARLTGEVFAPGSCPWPSDLRRAIGLVPSAMPAAACKATTAFKESPGQCETIDLAYVDSEPWASAAQLLVEIAKRGNVPMRARSVTAQVARRRDGGNWDVLLTVASNYYSREYPTLLGLLDFGGSQHLSHGDAYSPEGQKILAAYEAKVITPPPPLFSALLPDELALLSRDELLKRVEADVAGWRAPILPLAFLDPLGFSINDRGPVEASLEPQLLSRRFGEGKQP